MRDKLDAWLSDGGTIRIVPVGAFAVAALLGMIPMWLEFGGFPRPAPRERVGGPLLAAWIAIFLATELARRHLGKRGSRRWQEQWQFAELERADDRAGVIDHLCAGFVPAGDGAATADRIHAALLQGIVDLARVRTGVDADVRLHASLLVPVMRRERRRQVPHLRVVATSRFGEGRGWASHRLDAGGILQNTYKDGRVRVTPDTAAESVRGWFAGQSYRSVLTLPVALRCMEGKRLAIVSVDASVPGVFTDGLLQRGFEQAVSPYIKLIALSLTLPEWNTLGRRGA